MKTVPWRSSPTVGFLFVLVVFIVFFFCGVTYITLVREFFSTYLEKFKITHACTHKHAKPTA